jgi:hypothetical protein
MVQYSVAQERVLFDLKQIADKPRRDVEQILGEPSALADDLFRNSRGTTYAAADLSNQSITRWRDFPGIYEINIFPTAERKIWYAHISTSRIYQ